MRHGWERLQDILEAIERIERYVQQGRDTFDHNELVQVWIIHHIQVIGEAVRGTVDDASGAQCHHGGVGLPGRRHDLVS
jgi:uncharacterized protein with HEPN domain